MINAEDGDEVTVLLDPYLVTARGVSGKPYGEDGCNQYTGKFYRMNPSHVAKLEMDGGYVLFDVDDAFQLSGPVE